jgi:hypothetical protein
MVNNNSGQGQGVEIPEEIKGWNWGAFLLQWIWGLGNKSYKTFMIYIPLAGIVFFFINGVKGNEWAWQNRKWESIEHFKSVQRKWAIAGVLMIGFMIIMAFTMVFFIMGIFNKSEVYKISMYNIVQTEKFNEKVGSPYESGMITGSIHESSSNSRTSGAAALSYTIEGPKGSVDVYVEGEIIFGKWMVTYQVIHYSDEIQNEIIVPTTPLLNK